MMDLRILTASAGTGKTWRLTEELARALAEGRARAGNIVATTFTVQAAAELVERVRARLLQLGRATDTQELLAARIGTVNAICGSLVWEYAFELGISPAVRVLDEAGADAELRRALASVVSEELADELERFSRVFEPERDWRSEIQHIMNAARANAMEAARLDRCARRSCEELDACLGPVATDDLDQVLRSAIDRALAEIARLGDATKTTAKYVERMRLCRRQLEGDGIPLAWSTWASLVKEPVAKASRAAVEPVRAAAACHPSHPRLRRELHRLIELQFQIARDALDVYAARKRERGVIDFIEQEELALQALRMPEVRADLAGEIDVFLVDEFQDTSPLQLAVFLELAALARESIWVGDPKQAIYGFRGADPALMDAAIETLVSDAIDPELVASATRVLGRVEALSISYRSRPQLVEVTNAVFAPAFARQDIPEAHTRVTTGVPDDPALGPPIERWLLEGDNAETRAAAVAAGVSAALGREIRVRGAHDVARPLARRDLAVLCRTNQQCRAVAEALAAISIPAVLARGGLLATLEGRFVCAGLALWIDPRDGLAASELARLTTGAGEGGELVRRAIEEPRGRGALGEPTVAAIIAARSDVGPVEAVEQIIAAGELRAWCAAWGDSEQRLANLDALRAHAAHYAGSTDLASPTGLVRHLEHLVGDPGRWDATRRDAQAVLGDGDAVVVSTWHAAKGLEWPVVVLFGLEGMRAPTSFGVHVISDADTFDVRDPLGGRWIRAWPNPYATTNQGGPCARRSSRPRRMLPS